MKPQARTSNGTNQRKPILISKIFYDPPTRHLYPPIFNTVPRFYVLWTVAAETRSPPLGSE
jgi:hypothetical protein